MISFQPFRAAPTIVKNQDSPIIEGNPSGFVKCGNLIKNESFVKNNSKCSYARADILIVTTAVADLAARGKLT